MKSEGKSLRCAKVRPCVAENLLSFLSWVTVGSLPDIARMNERGKTLEKRDFT